MNVLVVGSGGREHALAWKLAQSPRLTELHAAPGNPGIARIGACHPVRPEDADALLALAHSLEADLVVVGPETPLVAGVADVLRQGGVTVFGPSAGAAQIEGSKRFAKDVMEAAGVPTAEPLPIARPPCVVKADGLAAGKGVFVCREQAELDAALRAVSALGGQFVVEELLEGDELSLFALVDGTNAVLFGAARDYSRLRDGDAGPNTGGMGSFSPVSDVPDPELEELVKTIHQPTVDELARRGTPFTGCLYAGLMLASDGPRVLEFNARFGDPETQVLAPRFAGDLVAALLAAATGDLGRTPLELAPEAAVTVAVAAGAYPEGQDVGSPITGIEEATATGALVFHAGTALHDGQLVTNGGRILNVTGIGASVAAAREHAYEAVAKIGFAGAQYRSDIGLRAAEREAAVRG